MAGIPADQQAHRDGFGRAITLWMKRNGWSQQTLHDWSLALGLVGGCWNSQASLLQRGKLDPKPQFWVALGNLNRSVAEQNLSVITSRSLRDRLTDCSPFLTADERIASGADFFAMFIGEKPLPEEFAQPAAVSITDEEAKQISEACRRTFRQIAQDQMLNPREAWEALAPYCTALSPAERDSFRKVLAGWADWSGEEATALSVPGQEGRPTQALASWANGLTLPENHLRRG